MNNTHEQFIIIDQSGVGYVETRTRTVIHDLPGLLTPRSQSSIIMGAEPGSYIVHHPHGWAIARVIKYIPVTCSWLIADLDPEQKRPAVFAPALFHGPPDAGIAIDSQMIYSLPPPWAFLFMSYQDKTQSWNHRLVAINLSTPMAPRHPLITNVFDTGNMCFGSVRAPALVPSDGYEVYFKKVYAAWLSGRWNDHLLPRAALLEIQAWFQFDLETKMHTPATTERDFETVAHLVTGWEPGTTPGDCLGLIQQYIARGAS